MHETSFAAARACSLAGPGGRGGLVTLVSLAVLAGPPPAKSYADQVRSPPSDCPAGSQGTTNHGGPYCTPDDCRSDETCANQHYSREGRHACRPSALCVRTEEYRAGRVLNAPPQHRVVVLGPCIEGACPAGGRCIERDRCVPEATARTEPAAQAPEPPAAEAAPGREVTETPTVDPDGPRPTPAPSPRARAESEAHERDASGCAASGRGPSPSAPGLLAGVIGLTVLRRRSLRR